MAGKYGVEIDGLDEATKILNGFGDRAIPEFKRAMGESVLIVESDAKPLAPWNIGTLRNSITGEVRSAAGNQVEGVVGSRLVYAAATEFGQRPHFPPLEPIVYWVARKLGISGGDGITVAFRIARKIARRGVDAKPFLIPAFKKNQERIVDRFHAATKRLIGG